MNKMYKLVLVGLLWLWASHAAQAAIELGFRPAVSTLTGVEVSLAISGLGAGALSAFDVDIQYDPDHLGFDGASFGDPLLGDQLDLAGLGDSLQDASLTAPGLLNLFESSLDDPAQLLGGQVDRFILAVLRFSVLQTASSQITISINGLADADGKPMTTTVSAIEIATPTAVPLPGMAWPMLLGCWVALSKRLTSLTRFLG